MKAISPVRSVRRCYAAVCCLSSSGAAGAAGVGVGLGLGVHHPGGLQAVDPLGVLGNMNDCYSRLKELVPSIPQDKTVSQVEILQHVIDYIFDLQIALQAEEAEEMVLSIKNADITRNFSKEDGRLCH